MRKSSLIRQPNDVQPHLRKLSLVVSVALFVLTSCSNPFTETSETGAAAGEYATRSTSERTVVMRSADITMDDLCNHGTIALELSQVEPGDIVFVTSSTHRVTRGGIFRRWTSDGEVEFVNASSYYGEVVVDSWPTSGEKREQWVVGAGRLLLPSAY